MSKIASIILFSILCFSLESYSQNKIYINPGLKFGYVFGQNGGLVWGIELSVVTFKDYGSVMYGGIISCDFCKNYNKFHIGFEAVKGIGADIGPVWIIEEGKIYSGYSVTPFIGVILFPYVSYTWIYKKSDTMEAGAFVKVPVRLQGEALKIGH